MSWFDRLQRRLRILCRKDEVEAELAEEVRLHVEMETGVREMVEHNDRLWTIPYALVEQPARAALERY